MKSTIKQNLIIDTLMFIVLLSIFMVKGEMHETMGNLMGILAGVHVILHWKQINVMFKQALS